MRCPSDSCSPGVPRPGLQQPSSVSDGRAPRPMCRTASHAWSTPSARCRRQHRMAQQAAEAQLDICATSTAQDARAIITGAANTCGFALNSVLRGSGSGCYRFRRLCLIVGFWRFNYIHRAASLGLPRHWVRFRARYYSCCAVVARLPLSWPSEALACNMI